MSEPALVTLHLWGVPGRAVPRALVHVAADRIPLRRTPRLRFAELLGTGSGRPFTPRDADPCRRGVLAVWERAPHAAAIQRTHQERWYAEELFARFAVVSANGCLDGTDPLPR